tara:strand:+ start:31981 stop:32943 length:963 start_codon:yes stop_codon:yes gene_type:complete
MKILITGVAGFIGFSLALKLLKKNKIVYGIDNLDNYYSVKLKKKRLEVLSKYSNFFFQKIDITNIKVLKKYLSRSKFEYLYHFAAQPGVRYSLVNPKKYYNVNEKGFYNILKNIKHRSIKKIIYASSSSVYGDQNKFPIKENSILKAKNPYGITKINNENTAKVYSNLFKKPFICLRFFTVYGEWGRPDMFIIKLLDCISKNKNFYLNKSGNHYRDFTNIKDVANICHKLLNYKCKKSHTIFNVCAGKKVNIKYLADKINNRFKNAKIVNVKANKADVNITLGDNKKITKALKYKKFTNINNGLNLLIKWYLNENIKKII